MYIIYLKLGRAGWDMLQDLLPSLALSKVGAWQLCSNGAVKTAHQSSGSFPFDDMLIFVEGKSYKLNKLNEHGKNSCLYLMIL